MSHLPDAYAASVPTLDDISLTVAAADRSNFGAVARARHVSQSTVSRAVQRVEASLGLPLFEREGRTVRLLPSAAPAVDALRSMITTWTSLSQGDQGPGTLSIFCTVTASQTIVPEVLATFRRAHPTVELSLRTGPASGGIDAVRRGEVDAAIAPLPATLPRGLVSRHVATLPLVAIAALDARVERGWQDAHLVIPGQGVTRQLVDGWRKVNLGAHTVQDTESHEEVVALTALGSGIGIVPRLVADSSALRPRLREVTPPARLPSLQIGLCAQRRTADAGPLALLWSMLG